MAMQTYAVESAILRTEKLAQLKGEEAVQTQIAMTQLYMHNAIKKLRNAGEEVILSFAEGDELRILLMGLKRFTKGYIVNPKTLRRSIAEKMIEENKYCF